MQAGTLTVNPDAELKIPVSPSIALNKNMVLEMSVKVEKLPESTGAEATPPPGPSIPKTGGIDFKGMHVESGPSETPLPEWQPPKLPGKRHRPAESFHGGRRQGHSPPPAHGLR